METLRRSSPARLGSESGQSLIETALVLPLILLIAFNAFNFGYFFFVPINLASAPREGVEYSIQGFATPSQLNLANAGPTTNTASVSWLTYRDMVGLNSSGSSQIQVCTKALGLSAPGTSNCSAFPSTATFPAPDADPEPGAFALHRVDVRYTVQPLIPSNLFGLTLVPSLTFHRQVSMRAMD